MIAVRELKSWLGVLADDAMVGIDEGGLTLQTPDGAATLEIGGLPEEEERPTCPECGAALTDRMSDDAGNPRYCDECDREIDEECAVCHGSSFHTGEECPGCDGGGES